MKLSVIIVSYNVKHYTEQCLRSVFRAGKDIDMEIFVVDNASHDGSPEYLAHRFPADKYPNMHIINNARNIGFGKANNLAAAKAQGEYLLFLNPDTIVGEQTLATAIAHADANPQMGGLGTMMLHSNGSFANESRRGLPTPWTALCKMSGLCSLFPKSRTFGHYYMKYLDKEQASEIEIISGAFFMARKSALDKTGLFDEQFFMYGEDIDLSYRLLQQGYKNHYIPAPILHYKGESTQKSTFKYVHIFYTAMLIFFKKHYRHYGILLTLPIKAAIILRAIVAVISQYIDRARRFIIPPKEIQESKYTYVGSHQSKVKEIAEKWCLDIECIEGTQETMPEPQLPATRKKTEYIIYDTADFSYDYILSAFRKQAKKEQIGTFNPETSAIITPEEIFTLHTPHTHDNQ